MGKLSHLKIYEEPLFERECRKPVGPTPKLGWVYTHMLGLGQLSTTHSIVGVMIIKFLLFVVFCC